MPEPTVQKFVVELKSQFKTDLQLEDFQESISQIDETYLKIKDLQDDLLDKKTKLDVEMHRSILLKQIEKHGTCQILKCGSYVIDQEWLHEHDLVMSEDKVLIHACFYELSIMSRYLSKVQSECKWLESKDKYIDMCKATTKDSLSKYGHSPWRFEIDESGYEPGGQYSDVYVYIISKKST